VLNQDLDHDPLPSAFSGDFRRGIEFVVLDQIHVPKALNVEDV